MENLDNNVKLLHKINNKLFIGCVHHITRTFLEENSIDLIVKLTGDDLPDDGVITVEYGITSNELMDSEIPRTMEQMQLIQSELVKLGYPNINILICCNDGKNKSPFLAGYLLATDEKKPQYEKLLFELEQSYFTPQQRKEEIEGVGRYETSGKKQALYIQRNNKRCLTNSSFKRILKTILQ